MDNANKWGRNKGKIRESEDTNRIKGEKTVEIILTQRMDKERMR